MNQFPESIPVSTLELIPESVPELAPKSELPSKRSLFRHPHKNRRLDPIMLRIDSRKKLKFISKRSILMEIPGLISLLKLLILIQELMLFSELIAIPRLITITPGIGSGIGSEIDSGIDSAIGIGSNIGIGSRIDSEHGIG